MLTLFDGRYSEPDSIDVQGKSAQDAADLRPDPAFEHPRLLVELTPWRRVFFGNLRDRLLFFRREPALELTSKSAPFWPDVFVDRPLPVAALRQSTLYHVFIVVALWGFSQTWLTRPSLPTQSPFQHQTITYYSVSEYLPPLDTSADSEPAKEPQKGEPEYARQRIISRPRNPESRTQTIVAPPRIKLTQDVRLPNIVAWTPVPGPVPAAAATHNGGQMIAPALPAPVAPAPDPAHPMSQARFDAASVVQPAPMVDNPKVRFPADLIAKSVVEPPPGIDQPHNSPNLPLPSAVEPAPSAHDLHRQGDLNVGRMEVKLAEPRLPVVEQRARGSLVEATPQHASGNGNGPSAAPDVPPAPSAQGLGVGQAGGAQATGQLIALGIHPVTVAGPITVPQGSRSGTFAAGPDGKHGAAGTPDLKGGGTNNGPGGSGSNPNSSAPGHGSSGPGIFVERAGSTPNGGVVVAAPPPRAGAPAQGSLLASLKRPSLAELARGTRPGATPSSPEPKIENQVFGAKKYYSMTLNMPNLISASGSWIIRFAELHVSPERGELTAPVATEKFDPAYPMELIRQRVEGTVVLYAVIHADGSVGEVKILHGVDDRLDENARLALGKWHFRPGTKNGNAVDLEAVVQIPFTSKRAPF